MMRLDGSAAGRLRTLALAPVLVASSLAATLVVSPHAHAATITSTAAGGLWTAGSTWIGGVPPAATDDVVLDGPVTVRGTASCAALDVSPAGALRNGWSSPSTLIASGAITNAGLIEDGPQVFRVRAGGDLRNDAVWTNVETILIGASDHRLAQAASAIFESNLTRDAAATGGLFIDTPFAILGNLDQDGARVELAPDCPLTLRAGALSGNVFAQGNEIRFESWSYLDYGSYDAAVLKGAATTTGGVFTGGLTILDSFTNVGSFGNGHAIVQGGLVNYGLIANDDYGFTIDLTGDLECYGTIVNSFIAVDDAAPRALRMGPDGDLATNLLFPEFGAGTFVVETDARISDGIALGEGGTMILEPGITLNLAGAGSIFGGTLLTQGSDIVMEGNGYLRLDDVDELSLGGSARTAGSMSVAGSVRNAGALQNYAFLASEIIVEADLVNTGQIRDDAQGLQTLSFRIRGDAINVGTWENQRVVLDGAQDQVVEIGAGIAVPEFVLAAGFAASSYQWTRDGAPIAGAISAELELATVAAGDAGLYRCEGGEGQLSRAIVLGVNVITSTPPPAGSAPAALALAPLRPNPLSAAGSGGVATIEFALATAGNADLRVFDVAGREVERLASRWFPAGSHRVSWAARGAAAGVYFVRLESAGSVATRKLTVVE